MNEPRPYVNMRGEPVSLDTPEARSIAKAFKVPDHIAGIPSPWWRRLWQRFVSRRA